MKLVYFDDFKLGVLKGDAVVDVSAEVKDIPHTGPGDLMNGLIEHWGSYKSRLEVAVARGAGVPVSGVRIRPPVPGPRTIDCMAVNYMEDGERSAPAPINAFHKSPSAIIGHGDTMVLPDVPALVFEGEAEMAAVIGRKCSHASEAEALSHVFGYMNFVDGSARGLPPPGNVFFQMKSRDTFAPIGPYLVTADEIKNPQKLQIKLWNNGALMQNFNTDDMGHNIAKCIAWLSSIHHRGLNPFMDGDTIELETEGLGRLKFGIKDDLKRNWARKTRLQMHEEANEKTPGAYPDITPQLSGKHAK
jgi:2-keto-4-pentenoate hydratase/2-oxohepta-3-ene-1,7-dioic acid hydratase in catechol pathway